MAQTVAFTLNSKPLSTKQAQEQRIRKFLSNYKKSFDITESYIDLRSMSDNHYLGIIPSREIGEGIDAILGPSSIPRLSIDPRSPSDCQIDPTVSAVSPYNIPKFAWIPIDLAAILAKFQRDVSALHIADIAKLFKEDTIIVPCAVKLTLPDGTVWFLVWDGHHTLRVCERKGWTHVPMWYTEVNITAEDNLEESLKALIQKAGERFLIINGSGKKALTQFDKHLIRVDTFDPTAVAIDAILKANGCKVKHAASAKAPGDISHVLNLYKAYELVQSSSDSKGIYLNRALKFHRSTWPKEKINSVLMRSLAMVYYFTEEQTGVYLPSSFDLELGRILKTIYGFAGAVTGTEKEEAGLRKAYKDFANVNSDIPVVVAAGLILTYNKHGSNEHKLAQPAITFPVQ